MSDETLLRQLNSLINGTINDEEHRVLQDRLKSDPSARTLYRERMDLEASLRTWAADDAVVSRASATVDIANGSRRTSQWSWSVVLTALAVSVLLAFTWWQWQPTTPQNQLAIGHSPADIETVLSGELVGRIVQQSDCRWKSVPDVHNGRFSPGALELVSGAAELRFDSGTNVVLESPCEIIIESADSARLLAGTVFVDVTEVSNGFLLETPESQIVDDGTQYAVSLGSDATEVHVFDGSVIWTPTSVSNPIEERISTGEARRYLRTEPSRSHRIPFGQRKFVRTIEADVLEASGGELIAYDGFENLAGQLRRGRSGFGWAGGWQLTGRGRGPLADVVDAPDDLVFGFDRTGRRLLSAGDGNELRRDFKEPISLHADDTFFMSLLASRQAKDAEADQVKSGTSLQISLEPESNSPRYTRRHSVSFGFTSDGASFVNNAGKIDETASAFTEGETFLIVFKYTATDRIGTAVVRVYQPDAKIDETEPQVWTVSGSPSIRPQEFVAIRITPGQNATWQIDELRMGTSWSSVTGAYFGVPSE
ncbi:FecR family protein [Aporhodopirellula aestuarii]|uniref:FecR family protein n=1 Tax=Aporhodopirellula aestuarii TaxID=2950107 RepID=A0ABT0UD27_9BACT|nr:FecR family protein [Aporhodopirellula aestuarii]MCM2374938.1 FecR family protein [Aporhodopirellula aestuarii]